MEKVKYGVLRCRARPACWRQVSHGAGEGGLHHPRSVRRRHPCVQARVDAEPIEALILPAGRGRRLSGSS